MVCWAVAAILPSRFARLMAFASCFFCAAFSGVSGRMINSSPQPTARFGSRLFNIGNKLFHLLVKIGLPLQGGKSVLCPVGTRLLRQEPDTKIISKHLFRCLPVLFVKGEEEKGQSRDNQKNQGNIVAQAFPGQKVSRNSH